MAWSRVVGAVVRLVVGLGRDVVECLWLRVVPELRRGVAGGRGHSCHREGREVEERFLRPRKALGAGQ